MCEDCAKEFLTIIDQVPNFEERTAELSKNMQAFLDTHTYESLSGGTIRLVDIDPGVENEIAKTISKGTAVINHMVRHILRTCSEDSIEDVLEGIIMSVASAEQSESLRRSYIAHSKTQVKQ